MELPTTPIEPTHKDPRSLLLYGPPKIGKTTILAQLPGNFIMDIEGGSEYVTALKKRVETPKELTEVGKAIMEQGRPYPFLTLDTVTELEDWSLRLADTKYRKTTQGMSFDGSTILELDYGLGYGLLREEFQSWFKRIGKLAPSVIYCAHVKDKILGKEKEEVISKDIDLTGKLKAIVASKVDAIGYIYIDPEDPTQRILTFHTSDSDQVTGNRCPHLEGKSFVISKKFGDDSDEGRVEVYWDKVFTQLKQ